MKKILTVSAVILGLFFGWKAYCQLAGTQRIIDNYWFAGDRKVEFGAGPNASINYTGGNLVIDATTGTVVFPHGANTGVTTVYLKSPNNTCYLLGVTNAGLLQTTSAACP